MTKFFSRLWVLAFILAFLPTSAIAAEPTVILDENFTAFTEGSEDAPATVDISSFTSKKLETNLPGWKGKNIYEAGEKLLIDEGGNIQTTRYDMSTLNGNCRISVRLRAKADYGNLINIYVNYTRVKDVLVENNKWQTVSFITDKGSASAYIKIQPMFEGIFIDWIKIEQSPDLIIAPVAKQPTQADGTSFTASWNKVSGATGYLVNVYSKSSTGDREYLTKQQEVGPTSTSVKISGLTDGTKYFYNVQTKVNDKVSEESNEVEVIKVISSLPAPATLPATEITADGFTANWEPVKDAESYQINVYREETFTADTKRNIIEEDFSGITLGSFESVEFGKIQEYLDSYTKTPGWFGYNHAFAPGYLVLSPFQGNSTLETPTIDLSGKVSITISAASIQFGTYYDTDSVKIYLINEGSTPETDEKVDSMRFDITKKEFTEFTFNTEKGSEKSYLMIAYDCDHKLYIDNVVISKDFKAGEKFNALVQQIETTETSQAIEAKSEENVVYGYKVMAIATTVNFMGEITSIHSPESELCTVAQPSGVNTIEKADKVFATEGAIVVNTSALKDITVWNINGALQAACEVEGETTIQVPAGIYIVRIGNDVRKVMVK